MWGYSSAGSPNTPNRRPVGNEKHREIILWGYYMKAFKLIAIVFVIVFLCLNLVACGNNADAIVGTWEYVQTDPFETTGTTEFKENGEFIALVEGIAVKEPVVNGMYEIDGNKLTIINNNGEREICSFEIKGDKMVMIFESDGYNQEHEYIRK